MEDDIHPNFDNITNSSNYLFFFSICSAEHTKLSSKQIEENNVQNSLYFTFYYTLYGEFERNSLYEVNYNIYCST